MWCFDFGEIALVISAHPELIEGHLFVLGGGVLTRYHALQFIGALRRTQGERKRVVKANVFEGC
jgi:hypothetical protein